MILKSSLCKFTAAVVLFYSTTGYAMPFMKPEPVPSLSKSVLQKRQGADFRDLKPSGLDFRNKKLKKPGLSTELDRLFSIQRAISVSS